MEILDEKYTGKEYDKDQLIRIMAIAAIIDVVTTSGVLATWGLGLVVEEAIEAFVSNQIAKYGKIKLNQLDYAIGAIPIPGVTAVTVHCARKLMQLKIAE